MMKILRFIPLMLLTACSTAPKLVLQPQPPSPLAADTVRYPEVVRAYHIGRYADPNDDLVMHEQHVVYRVEENTRWDLRPLRTAAAGNVVTLPVEPTPRDAAFDLLPVNDAVLAEVNAQKLASVQIMMQAQTLSSALAQFETALQQTRTNLQEAAVLRASISDMKHRLDALEAAATASTAAPISTTNATPDSLSP